MASDKDKMRSSANYYKGLVTAAKNCCGDAFEKLIAPINEIERCWNGVAGDAMAQSLESIRQELFALHGRLQTLEQQMKSQTDAIYDQWPEPETEEEG